MFPVLSANGTSGYNLNNSLRFRRSATAYLSRTPASAGSQTTWTWSGWVKRGILGSQQKILTAGSTGSLFASFEFIAGDNFQFFAYNGSINAYLVTTQVFRDPSAWYHIVFAVDTTQATSTNRIKIYVNGTQVTAFSTSTYPSQNFAFPINNNVIHNIGRDNINAGDYFDGYMAEVNFVNAQQLTPSSFGSTNATTGVWQPAKYTGTYGTNGFYLQFSDIATTSGSNAGLGKDFSGNANYWTTNNISVTAGTTYDAMLDVPTNTSATVANYAVMNPLSSASGTLTNGNLTFSNAGAVKGAKGTFALESGKWYWENTITTLGANDLGVGILFDGATDGMRDGTATSTYSVFYQANTNVRKNGSVVANYASYTTGDIIGIAYDAGARSITFYKNNTSQGSITADAPTSPYVVWIIQPNSITATVNINFGQRPFSYTPPSGFVALNTFNLPTPTILQGNKYMDATLYTGNGSTQTITNVAGFKPDAVWIKSRSTVLDHLLSDSVRGASAFLQPNLTNAEGTAGTVITSFNSNGFSIGSSATINNNTSTFVGWQWQAGQGTNTSNTSGSITSTVSVNATAGFSIVTYTGTGANATVGHGLGVAPSMVIVKSKTTAENWMVYHISVGATKYIYLDSNGAAVTLSTIWNNTAPTSSVFSIGTNVTVNQSSTNYVAYCWAEIAGFSKFGSYTGNGSADGTFVYTGFRPKFIMIKCTDTAGTAWVTYDTSRDPYNVAGNILLPNSSSAELSGYSLDIISNGFKQRQGGGDPNASSRNYIYAAFAENPFKNANAR